MEQASALSSGDFGRNPFAKSIKSFFICFAHIAGEDKTDGLCDFPDHLVLFLLTTTRGFDLKQSKHTMILRISLNGLWLKDDMSLEPLVFQKHLSPLQSVDHVPAKSSFNCFSKYLIKVLKWKQDITAVLQLVLECSTLPRNLPLEVLNYVYYTTPFFQQCTSEWCLYPVKSHIA